MAVKIDGTFKHHFMLFASIGALIFVAGTLIGRAQQPRPDFEITVDAPGTITATCIHGCQLQWSKPIAPERVTTGLTDTMTYPCPGGCKVTLFGIVVRGRAGN